MRAQAPLATMLGKTVIGGSVLGVLVGTAICWQWHGLDGLHVSSPGIRMTLDQAAGSSVSSACHHGMETLNTAASSNETITEWLWSNILTPRASAVRDATVAGTTWLCRHGIANGEWLWSDVIVPRASVTRDATVAGTRWLWHRGSAHCNWLWSDVIVVQAPVIRDATVAGTTWLWHRGAANGEWLWCEVILPHASATRDATVAGTTWLWHRGAANGEWLWSDVIVVQGLVIRDATVAGTTWMWHRGVAHCSWLWSDVISPPASAVRDAIASRVLDAKATLSAAVAAKVTATKSAIDNAMAAAAAAVKVLLQLALLVFFFFVLVFFLLESVLERVSSNLTRTNSTGAADKTAAAPLRDATICSGEPCTMYHGTTAANAHSIVANGFELKHCKRMMLGPGVYASQDVNKAKTYGATLLKLRVWPGRVLQMKSCAERVKSWNTPHATEYDSAWVLPGVQPSGEEHCVRDPRRIAVLAVIK